MPSNVAINQSPRWSGISNSYFVVINSSKHGIVKARIPDKIDFAVRSEWSHLFPNPSSSIANFAAAFFGITSSTEVATMQVWQGTTPIEIRLDLEFVAEYNAEVEIVDNIKKLSKMVLPKRGSSEDSSPGGIPLPSALLRAPGPRVDIKDIPFNLTDINFSPDSDVITVDIGEFLRFRGVIMRSLAIEFDGSMLRTGHPIKARCQVEFSTFFVVVAESFDRLFITRSE